MRTRSAQSKMVDKVATLLASKKRRRKVAAPIPYGVKK